VKQGLELPEAGGSEVAELSAVDLADGAIEAGQQGQAIGGNADEDAAPVLLLPQADDQAAGFEAIEKPRDIRVAGDHALGDLPAKQAVGRAAQDAKSVVLRGREFDRAQQLGNGAREQVEGTGHFDKDGLFPTGLKSAAAG